MKINHKVASLLCSIVFVWVIGSCNRNAENQVGNTNGIYYTCPMHPSVISKTPGVCPVCNMSLVRVESKSKSLSQREGNFVTLDLRQQTLAGIRMDTARLNVINHGSGILGTVALDETQVTSISSRVSGRIDKLYIKASGEFVSKGSPLYKIYSEELLANEKEFVLLTEKRLEHTGSNAFLDELLTASRNKLLLWGLTPGQLSELVKSKSVSPQMTFYSPASGYVTDVLINEGMYVAVGSPILKITSLNAVWVEAQLYSNEIINGPSFEIFTSNTADETFKGRLVYTNPVLEADRKFQLLRIKVDNANGKLIPGMMVYVKTNQKSAPVLSVPKSAVLMEQMKTVWIKADATTFEQRMVETGISNGNLIEILSGVKEDEVVVSSGAYLVNSEFILKSGSGQRHDH